MLKTTAPFILLFLVIALNSCKKEPISADEYVSYVRNPDNGLRISHSISGVNYTIQYKPLKYMEIVEPSLGIKDTNSSLLCFNLEIEIQNNKKTDILKYKIASQDDYLNRINYLSYGLSNELDLTVNGLKASCVLFSYIPSYGMSPKIECMLGFERPTQEKIQNLNLQFNDQMFDNGTINFSYDPNALNNLPEIKSF